MVPGVRLPKSVLDRMQKAGEGAPEEGVRIALEIIDEAKSKKGISGIHLMTMGWESIVQRIVTESGICPPSPLNGV
jgi:methylenetetrahydrofolate reductase (NADPH)